MITKDNFVFNTTKPKIYIFELLTVMITTLGLTIQEKTRYKQFIYIQNQWTDIKILRLDRDQRYKHEAVMV